MEELKKVVEQELKELERIKKAAERDLENAPEGTLRIARNHGRDQYYWRTDPKDTRGKYIRKKEENLIKGLAQKEYAQRIITALNPLIENARKELRKISDMDIQDQILAVSGNLSPARQKLISTYVYTEDEYAKKWIQEQERKKEKVLKLNKYPEVCTEIYTEKEECVRSKSEKILADKFYMMKIPYLYEVPLFLKGYGYIRPDFTVLNKRNRKVYYWEHLGMMDDKEYCEKAIKKIETLEKNEIFPGKNLILTYETKEHPLNMKIVEKLIEKYLV